MCFMDYRQNISASIEEVHPSTAEDCKLSKTKYKGQNPIHMYQQMNISPLSIQTYQFKNLHKMLRELFDFELSIQEHPTLAKVNRPPK